MQMHRPVNAAGGQTATFKYPAGLNLLNSWLMDSSVTTFRSSERLWAAFSSSAVCREDWEYMQDELETLVYYSIQTVQIQTTYQSSF